MRHRGAVRLFQVALFLLIVAAGFGQAVLQLWNWLMPKTFGLHAITYWQALGLLCLSWILFGGPRGWFGHRSHWRHRFKARWDTMTPEEREKFRQGMGAMRGRCGHLSAPAGGSKV
jgi:Ca2+/H+ antiporter, TMEM165/GDT1 family